MAWGYHLILDLAGCDGVENPNTLYNFVGELVPAIGMKAHGEPIIEHFDAPTPEDAGYTVVQIILTSTITGHFIDRTGDGYIDIFSCCEFETEAAKKVVKERLNPKKIKERWIIRDAHSTD